MFDHISWNGDAMVVNLPRQKGDQEGVRCFPKHIYANHNDPLLCPILTIGLHIICSSYRTNNAVFVGNAESSFSKWLYIKLELMSD